MNPIENILSIVLMVALGYFLKRKDIVNTSDVEVLNKLVMNLFLPSLVFLAIFNADSSYFLNLSLLPLFNIAIGIIMGVISFVIFNKILGYDLKKTLSVVVVCAIMNTAFLGFPVTLGTYGQIGLLNAVFFDMGTSIMFILLSLLFINIFGGSLKDTIIDVLKFPVLIALILGIIANLINLNLDFLVVDVLSYLSAAAIPVIMIALGISLNFKTIKTNSYIASYTILSKLIIAPIIALIIIITLNTTGLLNIGELTKNIILLESAMPSAMLALTLAIEYDLDFNLTAACVFSTTIVSLITLPIIISII